MRWSFHRRRNRRYQIALEELNKTFVENGGAALLSEIISAPKRELTRLDKVFLKELKAIKACFSPYSSDYKKRHSRFLKILRRLLSRFEKFEVQNVRHSKLYNLSLELCKTKFYRVHLFLFGHHLLQDLFASLINKREETALNFDAHFSKYSFLDESHLILNSQPIIFLERDIRKLTELTSGMPFDPHQYNHPFLLYTLAFYRKGEIKRLKMVRMGSPTKETWRKKPEIIGEFKGFLTKLKLENKNHLYVNKQRTWGSEGMRSHAIQKLEDQFDNFFCLSLPSDGAFYYQEMSYANQDDMKIFKETFFKLLIGKLAKGYYHIPEVWLNDEKFLIKLKELLDFVHKIYFNFKENLSVMERRFFIDHFYTQLILFSLQTSQIDSINITCRDGIDRAGCEQAKLLYFFQLSLGIEEDLESKIEWQFLLHIPPYLAKNRPMVRERREYLHSLLKNSYSIEVKKGLFEYYQKQPLLYHKPHFVKRA